ncbi:unnamed protein product [Fraxinus pennsylvanica]|uniref:Uncharacterized protein n=1 Tax=Fraxinus pennsylvanica TaxID=56036 RepID=A0AAD1YN02_9LAMI|nr:unnamed protein product [Fraxinus pennsylvanica]
MGGQTLEQGDYSRFKGTGIPHCCKKDPIVVDLLPGTPYNQQIANCCKGGVINSWMQDPTNAASPFQLRVGSAGTTNKTLVPKNIWTGLYLWTCKSGEFDQCCSDMEPYVHIFTVSGPKISNLLWSMSSFYNDTINAQLVLVDVRITSLSQEVVWTTKINAVNYVRLRYSSAHSVRPPGVIAKFLAEMTGQPLDRIIPIERLKVALKRGSWTFIHHTQKNEPNIFRSKSLNHPQIFSQIPRFKGSNLFLPNRTKVLGFRHRPLRRVEFEDDGEEDEHNNPHSEVGMELDREMESITKRRRRSSATIIQLLQDLLLQHLAENDPNRYGTLPAKKEAVQALPIVKIEKAVQCSVC